MSSPAFQFYPADFLADENVALMTNQAVGCYIKLICYCWREVSIPQQIPQLARLCGEDPASMAIIWKSLKHCFKPTRGKGAGRLIHPRLERERRKQVAFKSDRSRAGRKGAESLWNKKAAENGSHAQANGNVQRLAMLEPMANDGSSSSSSSLSLSSSSSSEFKQLLPSTVPLPLPSKRGWAPTDLQKRLAKLIRRRESTRWSEREIQALKALGVPAEEDLQALEAYYAVTAPEDRRYLRRDLLTILNNFPGEVDRARNFTPESLFNSTRQNGTPNGNKRIGRSDGATFEIYEAEHQRLFGPNGVAKDQPIPDWAFGPET